MKKRILVLLSVVALMVVMLVVTVAPAFAAPPSSHPTAPASQAYFNGSDGVSNCAADPSCSDTQVGQSHHESFPKGQAKFPPDTGPR
jgi:hypothetical protein